jgi:hypothetical protein
MVCRVGVVVTIAEQFRALGLGFVQTWAGARPGVIEVFEGDPPTLKPGGSLVVRVVELPGEHPVDHLRRALVEARRARMHVVTDR